jgi:tubulin-like protein CetZ
MAETKENRVVVTDIDGTLVRIKSDGEIVRENEQFEKELKEKRQKLMTNEEAVGNQKKMEEDMTVMLVEQSDRSINVGVVGVGQCGSKIAEEFFGLGYNVVAINTAIQDLKTINIPEKQKLFLDYALGGAAKDLSTGCAAAQEFSDAILQMLKENFEDCNVLLLAISGGGGTGSGAAETMVTLMSQLGKPISVLYVLPLSSEDALAKHNAVHTLSKLAQLSKNDVINSLIVADNSRIELNNPGLPMSTFWKVANKSIVEPLHLFNKLSANASEYTSLDPMDFSRIFIGTGDCALYGCIEVNQYMEDSAIAEAMITNLENGLLCADFDLTQTRSAGIIITGSKEVLSKVPATNLEYGFAMVSKVCNEGTRIFRGVYQIPGNDDVIRIYSFFSGLGLPEARVLELKVEADKHMEILKNKEDNRASSMNIDMGKTQTVSAADALHKKITTKHSAMGKLTQNARKIVDKRRR